MRTKSAMWAEYETFRFNFKNLIENQLIHTSGSLDQWLTWKETNAKKQMKVRQAGSIYYLLIINGDDYCHLDLHSMFEFIPP